MNDLLLQLDWAHLYMYVLGAVITWALVDYTKPPSIKNGLPFTWSMTLLWPIAMGFAVIVAIVNRVQESFRR